MRALVVLECGQAGEVLGFPPAVRFSGAAVAASGNETTGGDGRVEGP